MANYGPRMALLLMACLCFARAEISEPRTTTFSLALRVERGEYAENIKDLQSLLETAQASKMKATTVLFLRSALEKVNAAVKEFEQAKQKEEAEKIKKQEGNAGPAVFADQKTNGVRPLKAAMAAKKPKVTKFKAREFITRLSENKVNFKKPFVIEGGMDGLDWLQHAITDEKLMQNTEVQLRYLSPVVAKKKRSFDQPQQQDEEQYEYNMINFEKYFKNCFNFKAKPDFRKIPGGETEHCEQTLAAAVLSANITDLELKSLGGQFSILQQMDKAKKAFLEHRDELATMVPEGTDIGSWLSEGNSQFFVLGPAGSGEQLRQEGSPFFDGLVYGKRRWFFMSPKPFLKLRDTAKDELEAASAFMFFEQQLGDLKDDHGLGGKGMEYIECNQNIGDLVFVPSDMIFTSLALEDSVSYKQHVADTPDVALTQASSRIWAPESGRVPNGYQASACYDFQFDKLAGLGPQLQPMQAQLIAQLMQQNFAKTPQAQNKMILNVINECNALIKAPSLPASKTVCPHVWEACTSKLEENLKKSGKSLPAFIPKSFKGASKKTEL